MQADRTGLARLQVDSHLTTPCLCFADAAYGSGSSWSPWGSGDRSSSGSSNADGSRLFSWWQRRKAATAAGQHAGKDDGFAAGLLMFWRRFLHRMLVCAHCAALPRSAVRASLHVHSSGSSAGPEHDWSLAPCSARLALWRAAMLRETTVTCRCVLSAAVGSLCCSQVPVSPACSS